MMSPLSSLFIWFKMDTVTVTVARWSLCLVGRRVQDVLSGYRDLRRRRLLASDEVMLPPLNDVMPLLNWGGGGPVAEPLGTVTEFVDFNFSDCHVTKAPHSVM